MQGERAAFSLPQRVMDAIKALIGEARQWLSRNGFIKLSALTDYDLAALLRRMRESATQANDVAGKDGPLFMVGAVGANSEGWQIDSKDDLPTVAAKLLAQLDDIYQNPVSDKKRMEDVFADIVPEADVERVAGAGRDIKQGYVVYVNQDDGSRLGPIHIMENKDGTVELDILNFGEGKGGNAIYQAVADFAYNNGLRFIGDKAGLSPIAQVRRTEQMLASALKHGTTRHLGGHALLEAPEIKGVEPLRWRDGDDAYNLRRLIEVTRKTVANLVPEIADIGYNVKTRRFEDANGEAVTDQDFKDLATRARVNKLSVGRRTGGVQYKTPVGRTTLKRAALFNSVARAERGQGGERNGGRNDILAELGRQLSEHQLDPSLNRILYSREPPNYCNIFSPGAVRHQALSRQGCCTHPEFQPQNC